MIGVPLCQLSELVQALNAWLGESKRALEARLEQLETGKSGNYAPETGAAALCSFLPHQSGAIPLQNVN